MFENKKIDCVKNNYPVHYSRIIASFYNVGGELYSYGEFRDWLQTLPNITEYDIGDIIEMATCGKLELETNASLFIKKYRKEHQEDYES